MNKQWTLIAALIFTLIVAVAVVIVVIALLIFGAASISNFSVALLVGLLSGVYSSLYIAAQLWLVWKGRELKKPKRKPAEE
ncbi:hypothetical protein DT075_16310 [Bacillus licheniformis]|nr:hypothetical protein DT075_16310 [Bacillus licheniformis]